MRACELCSSVLHLPVHVQSGSAATRVRQRSQGVRLRSHDADVLVYDNWHTNIYIYFSAAEPDTNYDGTVDAAVPHPKLEITPPGSTLPHSSFLTKQLQLRPAACGLWRG